VSLRDLFLFGTVALLLPMILAYPYIGALAWVVFGIMNPHRLTWGPAYDFQFSFYIAVVTIVGLLFTRQHRMLKGGAPGVVLIAFTAWICFTALFPFNPGPANAYLDRVMKIFLMTGVLMLLLHTRRHVELLVWTMVVSLGFYGVKGGIFTIVTGGQYMVNGPNGSVMEGNNALGVGLVIVIPLMMYLYQQHRSKWLRLGLLGASVLCAVGVLGTYSRGALLAVFAMGCVLWYRSAHKMGATIAVLLFALIVIPAMPERWTDRMKTLETYEQDLSAVGRLVAWQTAFNIAKDRFPIGGGFEWQGPDTSAKYSPDVSLEPVAHSIYFQVLGSQGFVGLAFFLFFWMLVWRQCSWIRRKTRDHSDLRWAFSLASMTQVAMAGYAVGGAFLDIAFWDLPYYLYAAVIVTQYVVRKELALVARAASAKLLPKEAMSGGMTLPPAGIGSP
jgi:probable O-glycosylation ligase (exosortase A-associated)